MNKQNIFFLLLIFFYLDVDLGYANPIYVINEPNGIVTITSRKPAPGARYRLVSLLSPRKSNIISLKGYSEKITPGDHDFRDLINLVSEAYELEPALVKAVIHVESAFQARATSNKGAMGLMQLMPGTAARFGVENAYHPNDNVIGGVKYLKMLLDRYSGNIRLALAAYNAGEGNVDRIMDVPPFAETQLYVKRVLKVYEVYRCIDAGKSKC